MGVSSRMVSRRALAALVLAGLAVPAARVDAAPTPPAIRAKQAQAQAVLQQIDAIDVELGRSVEAWDGARYALKQVEARLGRSKVDVARARAQYRQAQSRVAERLVQLYTSRTPSTIDVVIGLTSLSEALDAIDAAGAVADQDHELAVQTAATRVRLERIERRLLADRKQRAATVAQLAQKRSQIESKLASRKRLLASVRSEVEVLQAREAKHQRELAAAARARVAREQARLAAARQAAAKAAALEQQKQQQTTTTQAPPATESMPPTDTSPTATTATTETQPTTTTTATPPPASGGHPEAASIALRYLGVPYAWGGGSPSGFDCSGLVAYVFAQIGITLPHFAAAQYGFGTPVARNQLQAGDLVFFDGLGHVGIYVGNNEFVHAPHTGDVVKITPITGSYAASYVGARRI